MAAARRRCDVVGYSICSRKGWRLLQEPVRARPRLGAPRVNPTTLIRRIHVELR